MSNCCNHDCRQGRDCPLHGLQPDTTHDAAGITVTEWRARGPRDCAELGVCQGRQPACEGCEIAEPTPVRDRGDRIASWARRLMAVLALLSLASLLHDILTQALP